LKYLKEIKSEKYGKKFKSNTFYIFSERFIKKFRIAHERIHN